jgi:hypothetical protein
MHLIDRGPRQGTVGHRHAWGCINGGIGNWKVGTIDHTHAQIRRLGHAGRSA